MEYFIYVQTEEPLISDTAQKIHNNRSCIETVLAPTLTINIFQN